MKSTIKKSWNLKKITLTGLLAVYGAILSSVTYFQQFYPREDLTATLYEFLPFQPNGDQIMSIHIGMANNGTVPAIISAINLHFPMIDKDGLKYNRVYKSITLPTGHPFEATKVAPGDLIEQRIAFAYDPALFSEADYLVRGYFLPIFIAFEVIDREGNRIHRQSERIFITVENLRAIGAGYSSNSQIKLL